MTTTSAPAIRADATISASGIARFVDLGNVDSAVVVIAEDLVRRSGRGIELHGRRSGAPPRGCSLSVEALIERD